MPSACSPPNRPAWPLASTSRWSRPRVPSPSSAPCRWDSLGIKNTEDLVKAAPSTYTLFRFGLQGNLSIRNQSSDFYFRGMRRIDPQGNFSTRWGANDSLEIVRGPASAIFGLGRIGGYVNFNPKTGRASTGKYLDTETGNVKVTYGSYDKKIISGEVSGPLKIMGKQGGYSVYAYYETGGSYRINNGSTTSSSSRRRIRST